MTDSRLIETHVSRLILIGDRVYKTKKPVRFGFVDLTTVAARTDACFDEVTLNRRIAPDVYEGVGEFRDPAGHIEPVVVMRRLRADRSLSNLVGRNDSSLADQIAAVAARVARFHLSARRDATVNQAATADSVLELWQQNLLELRGVVGAHVDPESIDEADRMAVRYIRGRERLFAERIESGRVVEGHGDLLADDIFCLADGPRIIDCLEFRADLRYCDVASDIAFLAMDLERLGRPDMAELLLGEYQSLSGDGWPPSLAHFYIAHRAAIRTKIACINGDRDQARTLLQMAIRHLRIAAPRLVMVGGLPGTGKSTLAEGLGESTGWPVLSTDRIRRLMAGRTQEDARGSGFGNGLYGSGMKAAVYSTLLSEAETLLRRGYSVILDASWIHRSWRDAAAKVAGTTSATLTEIRCDLETDLVHARLTRRASEGNGESDATPEIADQMAIAMEPWLDAVSIDSSASPAEVLACAVGLIEDVGGSIPSALAERSYRVSH